MRFHVLTLPHTQVTDKYISCAYTTKAKNFCNMMYDLGHEVFLYAGDETDANCTELIEVFSREDQNRWFGDYSLSDFYPITWNEYDPHWVVTNLRTIDEIKKRLSPEDFICVIAGTCQRAVASNFPNNPTVEYGIGYDGVFADYKVFESYAHMHNVYGKINIDDGVFYDTVIPNYYNPEEFQFRDWLDKEDYYVFLGRFTQRKGVEIAVEATRKLGAKLVMAGQGATKVNNVYIGDNVAVKGKHLKHIGLVDIKQKSDLLSKAKAVFVPTLYLEPFGGVAVEAMMCGTPVITTDFGAFTETVQHGVTGFRCRTVGEAAFYASQDSLDTLEPRTIRQYAVDNYSMNRVKYMYQDYFEQVNGLYTGKSDWYGDWHGELDRYRKYI